MKKHIFRTKLTILILFFLSGCMTPYQPNGIRGGYSEMLLSKDIYSVSFKGNGNTPSDMVRRYALRRAAELTLSKNYKYFLVINGETETTRGKIVLPSTVHTQTSGSYQGNGYGNTSFYGNSAHSNFNYSGYGNSDSYTTINPGSEFEVKSYNSSVTIKMLSDNKGYPQAFDAAIVLSNYQK